MNDIKEETHSVGQQGIKSTSSQPPDVNRETTKVKLKACTVVLMDMFKPDSDSKLTVCVGTRNESGSSGSNNAGISLQKIGDVMPEEMDVEETAEHNEKEEEERNSVDRLTTSSPQSVTKEVLEYSQADVDRMQKEWKLEFQGRLLAKEYEWLKKLEAKDKEKNSLNDMVNKLKQSNAQLKREVAEYERKVVEIIAEKAIKNVKEETGLTQLEDQMLAPDSVENQNSTSGDDTYHQSEDIDACPVTRVKCEEDPFDKRDSDMTTDREVCSGGAAKEMFTVSETDRTEERGGTPGRSMYTAPKEEDGGDEIESDLKPYACPLCGESYVTLSRLHCHQILHHRGVVSQTTQPSVKPFTCKICHAAFTHKTGLLSHERFHSRDSAVYGPAKPNGPNHQVMSRSRVESEKSVSGGAQSSACSSREKGRLHSGKKPYSFNGHGRYAEMPFSCSICKARFTHIHGLMSHERIHLSKSGRLRQDRVIDRNSPLIGVFSHACAVCTKSFTTKSDLRIHELSHATKNPFSCINCGESYADFSSFQHHKLSCSQKKPYPCSFCNKSFFSVQGQKNHEQLHADIKKFFCDVCGESFARKKALNRHELIHTRIIPC